MAPPKAAELWVDPQGAAGEGTPQRPLRTLPEALALAHGPTRIHLASGLYKGPFALPTGVELHGDRAAVLYLDVPGEVVTAQDGSVGLVHLTVQGGTTGLLARAQVRLEDVQFSGQKKVALQVASGAAVTADRVQLEGTVSETTGILVEGSGRLTARSLELRGGLRDGVRLMEGASADLENLISDGPVVAVRSTGGTLALRGATISGGRGPGVYLSGGKATLEAVSVHGHEYGLLTGAGLELEATGFTSVRADRAGLSLVGTRAQLSDLLVVDAGSYGGLQAINSTLLLRRFVISHCKSAGITIFDGSADLGEGVLTRIIDDDGAGGDAIVARLARVKLASLSIRHADGAGVLVAQHSQLAARDLLIEQTRWGGILAETGARVDAVSVFIRESKGAAIVVPSQALVRADLLLSADNAEGEIWAECAQGAQVQISRLRSATTAQLASPCIARWSSPRLFDPMAQPPPNRRPQDP